MFEDSLLSSQIAERDRMVRFAMLSAAFVQCSLAVMLWIAPLLHPDRLSYAPPSFVASVMPIPHPPKPHVEPTPRTHLSDTSVTQPAAPSLPATLPRIARALTVAEPQADPAPMSLWKAAQTGLPAALQGLDVRSATYVSAGGAVGSAAKAVRVSSGVSSGLLLAPIRPVYPSIASAARIEGTVTVEAVISRTGEVLRAHVTSGPPLLAGAALDAVQHAHYRPYKLNDEPTEVETAFAIVFRLGGE